MGWQDRDYNRSRFGGMDNPVLRFLSSSIPLGTWFGIAVRVHIIFVIFVVFEALFRPMYQKHVDIADVLIGSAILFVIVLLHEFGHCFGARVMGGDADQILMWPFGGLAFVRPPHRPWPAFVCTAAGPFVNVLICIATGAALWSMHGSNTSLPWNPFATHYLDFDRYTLAYFLWLTFFLSYVGLLFNLLPIFPLDGGRMLQEALWPKMGYHRSMMFASSTGMIGAVVMGIFSLTTGGGMLLGMSIIGFMYCYQQRMQLREIAAESMYSEPDYGANYGETVTTHRRVNKRAIKKAQRREAEEREEQEKVDAILAKVSAQGMNSLTWWERRTLRKATERQRKRDLEFKEEMARKGY